MVAPPCCISLEKSTKWIALAYLSLIAGGILVVSVSLVVVSMNYTQPAPIKGFSNLQFSPLGDESTLNDSFAEYEKNKDADDDTLIFQNGKLYVSHKHVNQLGLTDAFSILILGLILYITYLFVGVHLWKGIAERNITKIEMWLQLQVVCLFLSFVMLPLITLLMIPVSHQVVIWIGIAVQWILQIYIMWIVYAYIQELKVAVVKPKEDVEEKFIDNTEKA